MYFVRVCVRLGRGDRGGEGGLTAAEAELVYCVFYQADKPIRGTAIDINFTPSPPISRYFSFNGRIHSAMTCEDL